MKNFKKNLVLVLGILLGIGIPAYAYTPITSQLSFGARGVNVTNLQTFLADNPSIYPEGLITGYYGSLTRAAVQRFQANYGMSQVGRVGPQTLSKLNELINSNGWGNIAQTTDRSAPMFYSVNKTFTNNSARFVWSTNENADARVFYGTSPVRINEGDENSVGFGATNGFVVTNGLAPNTTQQVTLTNLQPNTIYYYMLVSKDVSGNVSVFDPSGTFRTNP